MLVGYTGGKGKNPSYNNMMDHTEALWIEFNPQEISYWEILEAWKEYLMPIDDRKRVQKHQYRTAVFWTCLSQQNDAMEFIYHHKLSNRLGPYDPVERANVFYVAESYHQNYKAKQRTIQSPATPCLSQVCKVPWKARERSQPNT